MKSLSYLNKYFFKYKWRLLLGVLFIIGSHFLYVNMPLIVGHAVEQFKVGIDPDHWFKFAFTLGGTYILLSIGKGVFLFFQRQTIIVVSRFIEYDLKNEIYEQYQRLSYNFYKQNNTGDLMNRISEDVSYVRQYLGPGVMYTLSTSVLFILCLIFMLDISPELTLYVLIPLPIMTFIIYKVSSIVNKQSIEVQKQQSKVSTHVQESFSGITVLKAYGAEQKFQEEFNVDVKEYLRRHMALVKTNAFFMPTITFLIGISTILTIYYGGILSFETQNNLTTGNIVEFIFYVNMLTWPFASVGWVTSMIQRAAASQERINEFLSQEPEVKNTSQAPFDFKGKIEFKNVSYTYPSSGIQAVKDLSFTINKGETLAILGRTGCGKSSVINLLMRQFDPTSGTVEIDGENIQSINVNDYRKQAGVVPQGVFLFSDSIRNNVRFGLAANQEATEEDIIDVLKTTYVWHNIKDFKQGLDTVLGERGVNLSGGQKQRISIARALIRKPKLLIFDDCLSAVDTETEEIILNNLDETLKESTSLIVSHRVSSIRNADRILVIENGGKIEEGTHDELLALDGVYSEIYNKQLLEEQEE
ncbi:ABC transporter ATP-binding protein [Brumimicrobium aurantiacum]|uniref:ABC transporter ATP-binding protein n=1 Tax=Brumimicrobium aurantiacum TaxID=1737063 RepID=A0A3E1EYB2_9FLAO|nr:ABC transporter ATP-binding protein [Brumimicrobium aurantiacum]RFC54550.1 ABC transporter ATP-binding protein [Brumimicrobium aurantiacum]